MVTTYPPQSGQSYVRALHAGDVTRQRLLPGLMRLGPFRLRDPDLTPTS